MERSGITLQTLLRLGRELGLDLRIRSPGRPPKPKPNYDWEAMQRALDDGLMMKTVAARFGLPKGSIGNAIRRGYLVPNEVVRLNANRLRNLLEANRDADDLAQALFEGLRQ